MLILFISFILALVALVCYAVKSLVAEAFSDKDWLRIADNECPEEGRSSYLENSEFEYGHDVEHRIKERL